MSAPKLLSFTKPTPDFSRKFFDLYVQKSMVDVTLSADGQFLQAHKVVLAVASSWFEELFDTIKDKHPVIVVKDLTIDQLTHIIEFIYLGAVNIPEDEAAIFKSTLESFRISLDDVENAEDYEDYEVDEEVTEQPAEDNTLQTETNAEDEQEEQRLDGDESDNFHEKLFELIENDENAKKEEEVKVKMEPEWDETLVKEESIKEEGFLVEQPVKTVQLPNVQQQKQVFIRTNPQKVFKFPQNPKDSLIRIRTPASINERIRLNEPVLRTVKIVHKLPDHPRPQSSTAETSSKTNIQELSKRLSKAILIRRVRKSDGSIVSERSPIKIVQGMNMNRSLPQLLTRHHDQQQQIFRCSHCNKAFTVNKRRNAHEKFCFKNPSRPPSQCPFCPMVLCNPMYISTHIRKVHGIDENGQSVKS